MHSEWPNSKFAVLKIKKIIGTQNGQIPIAVQKIKNLICTQNGQIPNCIKKIKNLICTQNGQIPNCSPKNQKNTICSQNGQNTNALRIGIFQVMLQKTKALRMAKILCNI